MYRLGSYASSNENEKQISVICAGVKKEILCNISNNYLTASNISVYKEIESKDSVYIYIPTLMDLQNNDIQKAIVDENFEKLHSISARYHEKKNIILDLRTNGGGNSLHASKFLANLYFLEKDCNKKNTWKNLKKEMKIIGYNGNRIDLISPAILQAENWLAKNVFSQEKFIINDFNKRRKILNNRNERITCYARKDIKSESGKPKFNGKLIILSGKNSYSASEGAILEAKSIFSKTNQFFQIGENSAGCYAYGNVWCYQLLNSGIALHLSA